MKSALITVLAKVVEKALIAYTVWLKSSVMKKANAAIEAGEKYIFTNEDSNIDVVKRLKLLKHYRKRFFKYNQ